MKPLPILCELDFSTNWPTHSLYVEQVNIEAFKILTLNVSKLIAGDIAEGRRGVISCFLDY
jgi:hypothetical protein